MLNNLTNVFKYKNKYYKIIYGDLNKSNKRSILCKDIKNNIYVVYININLTDIEKRNELHIALKRTKKLRELRFGDYRLVIENINSINLNKTLLDVKEQSANSSNIENNIIDKFRRLNQLGQNRMLEYLNDLLCMNKYV